MSANTCLDLMREYEPRTSSSVGRYTLIKSIKSCIDLIKSIELYNIYLLEEMSSV